MKSANYESQYAVSSKLPYSYALLVPSIKSKPREKNSHFNFCGFLIHETGRLKYSELNSSRYRTQIS